jgi:FkbH-like protein
MSDIKNGLLISDFNIENLASYLRNGADGSEVACEVAPYGQLIQTLLDPTACVCRSSVDFAVVWSRPESVLASFKGALTGLSAETSTILREVDEYCETLLKAKEWAHTTFVLTWVVPTFHHGHGMLDLAPEVGVARLLMEANLRLLQNLDGQLSVIPLNASKWIEVAGEKAFNPRLWYTSKIPFGNDVFKAAARDIKAALRGLQGRTRKLLIVDLDDTLWGGIVGDVGWEQLTLGGHDPAGEAFVDFQREVKALTRRGIILAIASKNEEGVALEAIRRHPEMVLRPDDFAGWRINWTDKAQNIADLCSSLNLGLDAAVFIDDNPFERERVKDALPDVLVPDWPKDIRLYPDALRTLNCFDKPAISVEDRHRSEMYATERQRAELKTSVNSRDEWLTKLELTVTVEALNAANLSRIAQLLNKTNQMNLSTRRMTEEELLGWASAETNRVWGFYVSDRFGDSGLTGVLGVSSEGNRLQIVDFILSCRVMGRRIEETMLHVGIEWARRNAADRVVARYRETAKNKPCLRFFETSELSREGDDRFVWDCMRTYPCPSVVRLTGDVSREDRLCQLA